MLAPKKVKHRKWQKGRRRERELETRGTTLVFGSYGLQALDNKWVKSNQLEAARRAILKYLKKGGKIWLRVFPDKPVTKKPPEVTMGGGKGSVEFYVFPVRKGRILFEIEGVEEQVAVEALKKAGDKLPVRTRIVKKSL